MRTLLIKNLILVQNFCISNYLNFKFIKINQMSKQKLNQLIFKLIRLTKHWCILIFIHWNQIAMMIIIIIMMMMKLALLFKIKIKYQIS